MNKTIQNKQIVDFYLSRFLFLRFTTIVGNNMDFFEGRPLSLDLFNDILDKYYDELILVSKNDPFKTIFLGFDELKTAQKRSKSMSGVKIKIKFRHYIPDDLGKTSHHYISNLANVIGHVTNEINIYWDLIQKNIKLKAALNENINEYIILKSKMQVLTSFKKSKECDRIQAIIKCIASLLRLDFMHMVIFFDSDDYKQYVTKEVGQSSAYTFHSIRREVLAIADKEARDRWLKGSRLLHYKMAEELKSILNTIFREKLLVQLEISYKNKSGAYKCEKRYKERKKEILSGKSDLSLQVIKKAIKKAAKKHKMYFDPGAEYR